MLNSVKCKNVKMYFSQIFPMIFLLISLKSCTFAAEIIFSGMNGIEERDVAEIATFTPEELREYEDSLNAYRDIKNSIDTARREGNAEGEKRKAIAIARKMKSKGFTAADISEMTGLSDEEIKVL